jgi:hypothetical protein
MCWKRVLRQFLQVENYIANLLTACHEVYSNCQWNDEIKSAVPYLRTYLQLIENRPHLPNDRPEASNDPMTA